MTHLEEGVQAALSHLLLHFRENRRRETQQGVGGVRFRCETTEMSEIPGDNYCYISAKWIITYDLFMKTSHS